MLSLLLSALVSTAVLPEATAPAPYVGGKPGAVSAVGRVLLTRPLPPPRKFAVAKYADKCGREKSDLSVVYSADRGLANVVVWIDGVREGKDFAKDALKAPVVLKAITCNFDPRVSSAPLGATLEVRNYDGFQWNASAFFRDQPTTAALTPWFSVSLPLKGLSLKRKLDTLGVVEVRGEAQPWAKAWVMVHDSPYVAVSDEAGYFAFDKVPAGTYTVSAWHEVFGVRTSGQISFDESSTARVELAYD